MSYGRTCGPNGHDALLCSLPRRYSSKMAPVHRRLGLLPSGELRRLPAEPAPRGDAVPAGAVLRL
jgi:hypothetical protein